MRWGVVNDALAVSLGAFQVALGFPCGLAGKESTCNAGDLGSVPGLGRSSGEGKGYPLQYSALENSIDCTVFCPGEFHRLYRGVTESEQLGDVHSLVALVVENPPAM